MTVRRWGWWLFALVGVAALVVGVVMLRTGLETADQLGSVVGSIAGVAGLGISGFALVLAIRAEKRDTQPGPNSVPEPGPTNAVTDSVINGPNIQIGHAGRDARIERDK